MLSWVSSVQSPFLTVSYISGSLRDSISVRLYRVRKTYRNMEMAAAPLARYCFRWGVKVTRSLKPCVQ